MTGTLEILVGPSAVGKSRLATDHESLRWTTRDIRPEECVGHDDKRYSVGEVRKIIDETGVFHSKKSGYFVKEELFLARLNNGEICGHRRYPNRGTGNHYGYLAASLSEQLNSGNQLVEQSIDLSAAEDVKARLSNHDVTISLVIGNPFEVAKRLISRDNDDSRKQRSIEDFVEYARNIDVFDRIYISNPEIMEDPEEIRKIYYAVFQSIVDNSPISIEYDTPDEQFRRIIPVHERFRATNPSKRERRKFMKKILGDRVISSALYKTYPGIAEEGNFSHAINSITISNHAEYYRVLGLFTSTLHQLGFDEESGLMRQKLVRGIHNYRWNIAPLTLLEKSIWEDMEQAVPTTYSDDWIKEYLKRYPRVWKEAEIVLKDEKDPSGFLHMTFDSLMFGNKSERCNYSPGLMQLSTIRAANAHSLIERMEEIDPLSFVILGGHCANMMWVYTASDFAQAKNKEYVEIMNGLQHPNVYGFDGNVSVMTADTTSASNVSFIAQTFSQSLSMQDYILCGLGIAKRLPFATIGIQNCNNIIDFMIRNSSRLMTSRSLNPGFRAIVGFEIYNFINNSYEILKADESRPVNLNNITSYPVVINPRQFVNTYWRENLLSAEEYSPLINDALSKYINIIEERYAGGMSRKDRKIFEIFKQKAETYLGR